MAGQGPDLEKELVKLEALLKAAGRAGDRDLSVLFPSQEKASELVTYLFQRRHTGTETADLLSGKFEEVNAQRKLNQRLDKVISQLTDLSISRSILKAYTACLAASQRMPVVKEQTLKHTFKWLSKLLQRIDRAAAIEKLKGGQSPTTSPVSGHTEPLVPPQDSTADEAFIVHAYPGMKSAAEHSSLIIENFDLIQGLLVAGLTDVWSVIRKACAKLLTDFVGFLDLDCTKKLFGQLVSICDAPKATWQEQEGALLGINACIKTFKWDSLPSSSPGGNHSPTFAIQPPHPSDLSAAPQPLDILGPANPWSPMTPKGAFQSPGYFQQALVKDAAQALNNPPRCVSAARSTDSSSSQSLESSGVFNRCPSAASHLGSGPEATGHVLSRTRRAYSTPAPIMAPNLEAVKELAKDQKLQTRRQQTLRMAGGTFTDDEALEIRQPSEDVTRNSSIENSEGPAPIRFLRLGRKSFAFLPSFMGSALLPVLYKMLAHPQLSIRETASNTICNLLARCPFGDTVACFKRCIHQLRHTASVDCTSSKLSECLSTTNSAHTMNGSPKNRSKQVLGAFEAEGFLKLCVALIRKIPSGYLVSRLSKYLGTLNDYLSHPATTVRQMTSQLYYLLVMKDLDDIEAAVCARIFDSLIKDWGETGLATSDSHTFSLAALSATSANVSMDSDSQTCETLTSSSWEWQEGRLLAFELIFEYLVAQHIHATFPSPTTLVSPARRDPKDTTEFSGIVMRHQSVPYVQPWSTRRGHGTPLPKLFGFGQLVGVQLAAEDQDSHIYKLFQMSNLASGVQGDRQKPDAGHLMKTVLLQSLECEQEEQWELRRMASQVIPLCVETLFYYDVSILLDVIHTHINPTSEYVNPEEKSGPACEMQESKLQQGLTTLKHAIWKAVVVDYCVSNYISSSKEPYFNIPSMPSIQQASDSVGVFCSHLDVMLPKVLGICTDSTNMALVIEAAEILILVSVYINLTPDTNTSCGVSPQASLDLNNVSLDGLMASPKSGKKPKRPPPLLDLTSSDLASKGATTSEPMYLNAVLQRIAELRSECQKESGTKTKRRQSLCQSKLGHMSSARQAEYQILTDVVKHFPDLALNCSIPQMLRLMELCVSYLPLRTEVHAQNTLLEAMHRCLTFPSLYIKDTIQNYKLHSLISAPSRASAESPLFQPFPFSADPTLISPTVTDSAVHATSQEMLQRAHRSKKELKSVLKQTESSRFTNCGSWASFSFANSSMNHTTTTPSTASHSIPTTLTGESDLGHHDSLCIESPNLTKHSSMGYRNRQGKSYLRPYTYGGVSYRSPLPPLPMGFFDAESPVQPPAPLLPIGALEAQFSIFVKTLGALVESKTVELSITRRVLQIWRDVLGLMGDLRLFPEVMQFLRTRIFLERPELLETLRGNGNGGEPSSAQSNVSGGLANDWDDWDDEDDCDGETCGGETDRLTTELCQFVLEVKAQFKAHSDSQEGKFIHSQEAAAIRGHLGLSGHGTNNEEYPKDWDAAMATLSEDDRLILDWLENQVVQTDDVGDGEW